MTVRLDLTASRNETWQPTICYEYLGEPLPLTGATIRMQWRLYAGQPGEPLIDLPLLHHVDLTTPTGERPKLRTLFIYPEITADDLPPLPTGLNQPEIGEADRYVHDIVILYADGVIERIIEGFIILAPGVVQNA